MKYLIIAVLVAAPAARAEFLSGNQLLTHMNSSQVAEQAVALGYVMGVHDADRGVTHCSPLEATNGQINDMVRKFLMNNPQVRHTAADAIVSHVLKAQWPCRNSGGSSSGSRTL